MKKMVTNITLIFLLVIFPLVPSYLHLYNHISSPKLKLCIETGVERKINILKGDLAYLEAIFSRAMEKENNEDPKSHELNNAINLLFFTSQSKFDFKDPVLKINKLLYSKNDNLSSTYLKIPSPPPKVFS